MPASVNDICIVAQSLACPSCVGVAALADALFSNGARGPLTRQTTAAPSFFALLHAALAHLPALPDDTGVWLATTVGAITDLEDAVTQTQPSPPDAALGALPSRVAPLLNVQPERIRVVSSACASSSAAVALAASAIRHGTVSAALVIGCDILSEFVHSGFAALMAIDPGGARPFDADRKGVTLGEAAACALLMRRDRAEREGYPPLGTVGGWGMTCDANHPTAPSRDGAPLTDAIAQALAMSGHAASAVSAICAHGTGTVYNDRMELLAFKRIFGETPLPTFSVKGAMGHTLGAAGLCEILLSLECLRRGAVPPTAGLRTPSPDADGWVSPAPQTLPSGGAILTTNSGFGGTNVALMLTQNATPRPAKNDAPRRPAPHASLPVRRTSPESQEAIAGVTRILAAASVPPGANVGIIATGTDGSAAANRAYFEDYVRNGRVLGRGQLFAATLPTSVAADIAIACQLRGPLLYLADERHARAAAASLMADGLADAFILLPPTGDATLLNYPVCLAAATPSSMKGK